MKFITKRLNLVAQRLLLDDGNDDTNDLFSDWETVKIFWPLMTLMDDVNSVTKAKVTLNYFEDDEDDLLKIID